MKKPNLEYKPEEKVVRHVDKDGNQYEFNDAEWAEIARQSSYWRIGQGLLNIRQRKRLTQKKMAQLMEVSPRSYQGYEYGTQDIPAKAIKKLAENAEIDLNQLLTGHSAPIGIVRFAAIVDATIAASKYLRSNYPNFNEEKTEKLIHAYVKLAWNTFEFDDEKMETLIQLT